MSDFKERLKELGDKMHDLALEADKLKNKHLRDIIGAGLGRFKDALGHPDIDLLDDEHPAAQEAPPNPFPGPHVAQPGDAGYDPAARNAVSGQTG